MTARALGKRLAAALAAALLVPAGTHAWAAPAPIYKCVDRNLGISYTDIPCKDGERLELRTGDADPAAIARLERERAAWDQSGAQRLADERRAYLQRRTYDQPAYLVQEGGFAYPEAPDYYPYAYGYPFAYGYGYYGYGTGGAAGPDRRRHSDGRFDRRRDHSRAVPAHPQNPRR
jgi:hypothetical protein